MLLATTGVKEAGLHKPVPTACPELYSGNRYYRVGVPCKAHMRPFGEGKVVHHTKAYNQQFPDGRYDRHWLKDKALIPTLCARDRLRGGLRIDSVSMDQVVSRIIVGEDTTAVTVLTERIDWAAYARVSVRLFRYEKLHAEGVYGMCLRLWVHFFIQQCVGELIIASTISSRQLVRTKSFSCRILVICFIKATMFYMQQCCKCRR